ncbi:MAG: YraN family protein [Oscillospiraceae bacterium]|nr:YraN family protein [Oscillospiraceae bacterium]
MKKTELGAWGESRAAELLESEGFRIVARNFRCRFGELDLIARKGNILAFTEVKLRKSSSHGQAREFVTVSKQQKLRTTASFYLAGRAWAQELQPRFDVVEIYAPYGQDGPVTLEHIADAFE